MRGIDKRILNSLNLPCGNVCACLSLCTGECPMARFHKMVIIGNVIRDPVVRTFANGGRVAKFGLPVDFTRQKKNPTTGQWEGESFIIDVDVFNRQNGMQLADLVEQYVKKGSHVYVEGR